MMKLLGRRSWQRRLCGDLLVDGGGDEQAIGAVGRKLPQLGVVPSLALVVLP